MKLFTISGLDGSGKSTQIELLKNYLESQGKKVFYFHAIQFGLANKLSRKNKAITAKSVTQANFAQIFLRRIFLMADLLRFRSLLAKLQLEGYDYVLSDRYFYDTVININFLRGSDKKMHCENFIIKPDVAIYLQADPEIIMSRERKPDQGLEYLQKKKELFEKKLVDWDLKVVEGSPNAEEIHKNITSLYSGS